MEAAFSLRISNPPNLTATQQKFWNLLQEQENRELAVLPLCEKAGYRSMAPWYCAMRDPLFRASVEALKGPRVAQRDGTCSEPA